MFPNQLLPAPGGEPIKFGAAIMLGRFPTGRDPAFRFQALQCGIERAELDIESVIGSTADGLRDSVAVQGAGGQRAENQHFEGSLQQVHIETAYMKTTYTSIIHERPVWRLHTDQTERPEPAGLKGATRCASR